MAFITEIFILFFISLFFNNIYCSNLNNNNYHFFKSYNQTGNRIDIELVNPFDQINITSVENFYYEKGTSQKYSCIFKSSSMSIDLTKFKNIQYFADYNGYNTFWFKTCPNSGVQSYYSSQYIPNISYFSETFQLGKYGIDDYALILNYSDVYSRATTIKFYCDWNIDFDYSVNFTALNPYEPSAEIKVSTKNVCPYINVKKNSVDYKLIQPNILSIYLNANSSNIFSFNNDIAVEKLNLEPIVYNFTSIQDGNIIIISGLFLKSIESEYIYMVGDKIILKSANIISFNSSTIVLNVSNYIDNFVSINLHGNRVQYKFSKTQYYLNFTYYGSDYLKFNCINCIGANLVGFSNEGYQIEDTLFSLNLSPLDYSEKYIYFKSLDVESNKVLVPTNITHVEIRIESFAFLEYGEIYVRGNFIKNLVGQINFSNGTNISSLPYSTPSQVISSGVFTIPPSYGEGNFSIYNEDQLIYSYSFSSLEPKVWVKSMKQENEKIELTLNYQFGQFFNLTNIKYANGRPTDYQVVHPNIIKFNLYPYSTNKLAFYYCYSSSKQYLHLEKLSYDCKYKLLDVYYVF
ncbi:hypothetical protein ACTFIV_002075 [Dictyostelium citrinum]